MDRAQWQPSKDLRPYWGLSYHGGPLLLRCDLQMVSRKLTQTTRMTRHIQDREFQKNNFGSIQYSVLGHMSAIAQLNSMTYSVFW